MATGSHGAAVGRWDEKGVCHTQQETGTTTIYRLSRRKTNKLTKKVRSSSSSSPSQEQRVDVSITTANKIRI